MGNRLPKGFNLGEFEGRVTYIEQCNCDCCWCSAPTVYYQGTDEVCWPQTDEVRTQPVLCGHTHDIEAFEQQSGGMSEALTHSSYSTPQDYGYWANN
ncbi:MAG: hypothetical protein OEX81_05300 [Candidatus Pacebacteria bacterium]|nr:hypothetical protein [Candidatus Paceibacterota bacterium]